MVHQIRHNFLETPIEFLKGVGPQRADMLKKELGIYTFADLLVTYPFRYIDRSKFHTIREVSPDAQYIQLRGYISDIELHGDRRTTRMTASFSDDTGSMELVWFRGFKWLKSMYKPGVEYIVFGKPTVFGRKFSMAHPEIEAVSPDAVNQASSMQPVYNSTEKLRARGLDSKGIGRLVSTLLPLAIDYLEETLPAGLLEKLKLTDRKLTISNIHFPIDDQLLRKATARLKFEELFYIQLNLIGQKLLRNEQSRGHIFPKIGDVFNKFYHEQLAFSLTGAQKRVLKEIRSDTLSGKQMNRLLQGDVGSGKTIVAVMSMLMAVDNGFQACLMAPTEILAFQHYESISSLLQPLGIQTGLLTGSTKSSQRRATLESLLKGTLHVIIGTHALIEDVVRFERLGMVIIDEQHRFGVAQRARLWSKSHVPPHVLVMTATPIPRTLAMTLYGDLDMSVIDELPPGRKPIKTVHQTDSHRLKVFGFMRKQIETGRQVYVVYPLIQESEALDLKDLTDGYESIVREFPLPDYAVSIVHGRMKPADKDYEMQRFVSGQTQIMVATTVIEVGIDVPNASVMVIESAERFGLSQLHQLRGRVGRGAEQSYCILMTRDQLSNDARHRIKVMTDTNDGFVIAETDLKLRGPGDLQGTQQSGIMELKMADLRTDEAILKIARQYARDLLAHDPRLLLPENKVVANRIKTLYPDKLYWGRIS
jgi:ATP-dependent DNA helicase RecG